MLNLAEEIQETTILSRNLPPRLPGNKLALRYKVQSTNTGESSSWSTVYYISAPTVITTNTTSKLTATDAESYSFQWTDENPVDEYDVFAAASIDCENFTLNRRSVGTTKYLYATTSNVLIANEFNRFYVGAKIDVRNIASALNGTELEVTAVNTTTPPYSIIFTGDSSDTVSNTATTAGGFYLSPISVTNPVTTTMLSKYEYVGTALATGSNKTFLYKSTRGIFDGANTVYFQSLRSVALTQIACSTKVADLSLFVVGSPFAFLV